MSTPGAVQSLFPLQGAGESPLPSSPGGNLVSPARSLQVVPSLYSDLDLVSLLRMRSQMQPHQLAYSFETDHGEVRLTYAELDRQACIVAAQLQAANGAGARALLLYHPGPDFLAGFFGCLYAGVIAVPAYPPRAPFRPEDRNVRRIFSIAQDASPRFVITTESVRTKLRDISNILPGVEHWLASDIQEGPGAEAWLPFCPQQDDLAFLQYTSGSTGAPKGVMVSHGNIIANERMISIGFGMTEKSLIGGWLPVFHDMGLIGHVLQPMYLGVPCFLMSPMSFMKRPFRWLDLISRNRLTVSGAPDFAYRFCVEAISEEEKKRLDLSSWELAFNGAEPVRSETLENFSAAFASCGFRRSAFYPTYGCAEATLFVAGGLKEAPPVKLVVQRSELERGRAVEAAEGDTQDVRVLIGCGKSASGQKLSIVHPDTRVQAAEGEVGEIWISGPNVTGGYWNRTEESDERFRAPLAGAESRRCYRTGDLGFLRDGELFITGRASDLIIIRGLNHYPEDIELTVGAAHEHFLMSCAVSIDVDGEERVVVVQEVSREFPDEQTDQAGAAARRALSEFHGLDMHSLILLPRGRLPRTSSGKVQRRVCREMLLKGTLEPIVVWTGPQQPPTLS
ncbi:fatty acyl-AMP ligase [Stigmatella erecta]|uniref:Acyl-CoA synthetase (AMP-forming)/AMP-acid ligase II n=1 Tax=Stigmatella erecta TaxID=83460 RepID=A0A1I0LH18_9BACT|nr:fatty acyl-AMP ligase [Stigmatella erecta]SEU39088.1 Acyl-CoA synthetase (AMP-forming)/AMP-acid ligase II [Stigmatella erecta]